MLKLKLIVTVPETHADIVREAIGKTGKDLIGKYAYCSFTIKGIGRSIPLEGAHPTIGEIGKLEEIVEDRIEISCTSDGVEEIITAIKAVHPYEEPVIDVYPLV